MAMRLEKILCATDFSEFSRRVVEYGQRLAAGFDARLFLFNAVNVPGDRLYATDRLERVEKQKKLSALAHEKMQEIMAGTRVRWEPVVSCGDPVEEIDRFADEKDIDLVIAASHGLTGLRRILLGAVVERLARTLPRPLLVIRPPAVAASGPPRTDALFKQVLVGCRPVHGNDPVSDFAVGFAQRLNGDLHLLYAMEAPMDEDVVDPTLGPYAQVQDRLRQQWRSRLDEMARGLGVEPIRIKTAAVEGLPGEALAAYAAKADIDMIIVGVRQRTVLEKLIVGSTTESVLRHAPCPVLTVPFKDSAGRHGRRRKTPLREGGT